MHHRRFHRRRPPLGARFYASENVLERLDEYQRDLEQELADVVELIKRLRAEEAPPQPRPSSQPGWSLRDESDTVPRRLGLNGAEPAASRSFLVSSITFWATWAGTSS